MGGTGLERTLIVWSWKIRATAGATDFVYQHAFYGSISVQAPTLPKNRDEKGARKR
jgi:hypothetical protein